MNGILEGDFSPDEVNATANIIQDLPIGRMRMGLEETIMTLHDFHQQLNRRKHVAVKYFNNRNSQASIAPYSLPITYTVINWSLLWLVCLYFLCTGSLHWCVWEAVGWWCSGLLEWTQSGTESTRDITDWMHEKHNCYFNQMFFPLYLQAIACVRVYRLHVHEKSICDSREVYVAVSFCIVTFIPLSKLKERGWGVTNICIHGYLYW